MQARFLFGRLILALLVGLVLLPPRRTAPTPIETDLLTDASLAVEEEWLRLTVGGTPYEMGLQQGILLRPYLRHLVANNLFPSLFDAGVTPKEARRHARIKWRTLSSPLRAELQGIADGAGLLLEDLVLWNLRGELLTLGRDLAPMLRGVEQTPGLSRPLASGRSLVPRAGHPALQSQAEMPWPAPLPPLWELSEPPDRFASGSMLASWGEATVDGQLWMGALLEAPSGGERYLLVERRPQDGRPVVGLALPGRIGLLAGVNDDGVVLLSIPFRTVDHAIKGLPVDILTRHVLDVARSRDEAARELVNAQRAGGTKFLVADTVAPASQQLELSARQFRLLEEEAPRTLAVGAPLEGPLAETAELPAQAEAPQRGRMAGWLRANAGFISRDALQRLMSDPQMGGSRGGVAIVLSPSTRELWLAQSAQGQVAPASGWAPIDLAMLWAEE